MYVPVKREKKSSRKVQYRAEASYEMTRAKRGGKLLEAGNYQYIISKKCDGVDYYACAHRRYPHKCKGSGKLDLTSDIFYSAASHTCDKPLPIDEDHSH